MVDTPHAKGPWLTIIGIGEDGPAGLGEEAKRIIAKASVIYGGERHHSLTADLTKAERLAWKSPFADSINDIIARRGTPVVVLASGDPFLFGVGATLCHHIAASEIRSIPAPSSFSLAASRLGWPLQDVTTLSLHGRPLSLIMPYLHNGRRLLVLTSDGKAPREIAARLDNAGFGGSKITILEALGGEQERVRSCMIEDCDFDDIQDLNLCAVDLIAAPHARPIAFAPGLEDDLFEHDGQITKRDVRAMTISALAPKYGELLWDIGAGSGSISIEWMLSHPSMRAIAIEQSHERAERISRNAAALGTPGLMLIEGHAPEALSDLPPPDAIFIGGGGSDSGVLEVAMAALKPNGRIVANAVTLEMEALLLRAYEAHGGKLTRISIARAAPVGSMMAWRPAMPVTQWHWVKKETGF
ncbi:precorrin-6y C5,15-methyltransferase (decarboxylating) subunit CbiE [Oryzifoliimicrobium ureilyticus]|uniref:precorrin-6y C5,15-methyltransferase (decarboxylating) subunit CbiE n=1 Tax=Oryzifoliimicrobium ureilyticus TaxID=3113724 RepID=UPI0030765768